MIGMEHVGVCGKDTKALKDWYVKLFNFEIVYDSQKERPTYFLLMEDGSMIEIYASDDNIDTFNNRKQVIRHIAFSTDDIEKEYKNLVDNNVEIVTDLTTSDKGVSTVFFRDIEGNILHFIYRPEDQKLAP